MIGAVRKAGNGILVSELNEIVGVNSEAGKCWIGVLRREGPGGAFVYVTGKFALFHRHLTGNAI